MDINFSHCAVFTKARKSLVSHQFIIPIPIFFQLQNKLKIYYAVLVSNGAGVDILSSLHVCI
jgi:hypothetical protein